MINLIIGFFGAILLIGFIGFFAIMYFAYKRNKSLTQAADNFISIVSEDRAKPRDYVSTFEHNPAGRRVLEQLISIFESQGTFVRGGQDAERESCYKQGQKSVPDFINLQLAKAKVSEVEEKEDESD